MFKLSLWTQVHSGFPFYFTLVSTRQRLSTLVILSPSRLPTHGPWPWFFLPTLGLESCTCWRWKGEIAACHCLHLFLFGTRSPGFCGDYMRRHCLSQQCITLLHAKNWKIKNKIGLTCGIIICICFPACLVSSVRTQLMFPWAKSSRSSQNAPEMSHRRQTLCCNVSKQTSWPAWG